MMSGARFGMNPAFRRHDFMIRSTVGTVDLDDLLLTSASNTAMIDPLDAVPYATKSNFFNRVPTFLRQHLSTFGPTIFENLPAKELVGATVVIVQPLLRLANVTQVLVIDFKTGWSGDAIAAEGDRSHLVVLVRVGLGHPCEHVQEPLPHGRY